MDIPPAGVPYRADGARRLAEEAVEPDAGVHSAGRLDAAEGDDGARG